MKLKPGSRDTFVYLLNTYRHSYRTLAEAVTTELERRTHTFGAPVITCSKSTIGKIVAGHVCSREIATAIEQVLQIPPGVVFVPRNSKAVGPGV